MDGRVDNGIYDRVASTWWDEDGFMALLRTSVNPGRSAYFRKVLLGRLRLQPDRLRLLDVGCGGGLLSEEFARLGCSVTGIDLSQRSLEAARAHAARSRLPIEYLESSAESLPFPDASFDAVSCCDMLEHVEDPSRVLSEIARVLKPGGVFVFDTINRTWRSKLVAIKLAQEWRLTRFMPRDVHVWESFIRPAELRDAMGVAGLHAIEFTGLAPSPNFLPIVAAFARHKLGKLDFSELGERIRLEESNDLSVSYMGFALLSSGA
jgi:2-polyprenyl-6-hydroxyphenyl methylase/3-demethylubiquinone-9 3-methyltransferase